MANINQLLGRNWALANVDARQNMPAVPFIWRQNLFIVAWAGAGRLSAW